MAQADGVARLKFVRAYYTSGADIPTGIPTRTFEFELLEQFKPKSPSLCTPGERVKLTFYEPTAPALVEDQVIWFWKNSPEGIVELVDSDRADMRVTSLPGQKLQFMNDAENRGLWSKEPTAKLWDLGGFDRARAVHYLTHLPENASLDEQLRETRIDQVLGAGDRQCAPVPLDLAFLQAVLHTWSPSR